MTRLFAITAASLILSGCVGTRFNYSSVRIETMGDNAGVRQSAPAQSLNADKQYSDVLNPNTSVNSPEVKGEGTAK
ncbi:MAG: hypothetical protein J6Y62_00900 [Clostridia bacterium]|nr:hypothetical protein [Clostridia bacterium]